MLTVRPQSVLPLTLVAAFFIVAALPAYAQTALSSAPPPSGTVAPTKAQPADGDLRSEVEQLKQLVREQQKRIDALETEHLKPVSSTSADLSATRPAERETPDSALARAANPQTTADQGNQHTGSSDERIRNLEREIKGIGPISFSGDI
jgi:hypothetical protein